MGKGRWLYDNLIASATASSAPTGAVGGVSARATGAATLYASGDYTGSDGTVYVIEIDSVSAGAEVAQATYRWKQDGATSWAAAGVTTHTALTELESGLKIGFGAGTGDDFALGDNWRVVCARSFDAGSLLLADPNREWRSTGVDSESIVFDLGAQESVSAALFAWHNLTSGATLTLLGSAVDEWDTPAYEFTVTRGAIHAGVFMDAGESAEYLADGTYTADGSIRAGVVGTVAQYWKLVLADSANADGYLRIAAASLGAYFEPSRNYTVSANGTRTGAEVTAQSTLPRMGATLGRYEARSVPYGYVTEADFDEFVAMHDAAFSLTNQMPLFFCPNSSSPGVLVFGKLSSALSWGYSRHQGDRYDISVSINELPRTR